MRLLPTVIALALLVCGPAAALAEGESPSYNVVSLSAEASTTVANDLLVAVVGATAEGSTVGGPADEVNKAVNWALELARGSAGVTVRTLAYRTSPVYRDNRLRGWRVQQSIRLESADSESLGDLIGRLQERLALESLGFELSSARRLEAEQALIARALAAFRERANLVTRELGRSGYRLVRAGVITGGAPPPRPMLRGGVAMAAEAVAPPVIEAGDQELTVRVDGAIEVTED